MFCLIISPTSFRIIKLQIYIKEKKKREKKNNQAPYHPNFYFHVIYYAPTSWEESLIYRCTGTSCDTFQGPFPPYLVTSFIWPSLKGIIHPAPDSCSVDLSWIHLSGVITSIIQNLSFYTNSIRLKSHTYWHCQLIKF